MRCICAIIRPGGNLSDYVLRRRWWMERSMSNLGARIRGLVFDIGPTVGNLEEISGGSNQLLGVSPKIWFPIFTHAKGGSLFYDLTRIGL
jgi:hypothetical protein